jgi:hypothetical protein
MWHFASHVREEKDFGLLMRICASAKEEVSGVSRSGS